MKLWVCVFTVVIKDETLKELKDVKELAALPELRKENLIPQKEVKSEEKPPLEEIILVKKLVEANNVEVNQNEDNNARQEPPVPVEHVESKQEPPIVVMKENPVPVKEEESKVEPEIKEKELEKIVDEARLIRII